MSIDELLTPRYKVIADYPDSCYTIGDILCESETHNGWFNSKKGNSRHISVLDKHPYIFKPLEWWEERKENEIPNYLKDKRDGEVFKLRSQSNNTPSDVHLVNIKGQTGWFSLYEMIPSTEHEFLTYQSTLTK